MKTRSTRLARIVLVAYESSPYRGSEWAVGWGRALQSAKHFETVLITGEASRADITAYIAAHGPVPNLQIAYVGHDLPQKFLSKLPKFFDYHYWAYNLWHRSAARLASALHAAQPFQLAHQVNICGFREPGYLWKLGIPFIWGPVGGTQLYPWRFLAGCSASTIAKEASRNVVNQISFRLKPRVKRAAAHATFVFAANSQVEADFERHHGIDAIRLLETGLHEVPGIPADRDFDETPLRLLWSGQFVPRKALPLLLKALAKLPPKCRVQLRVLGRGPLEREWKRLAEQLDLGQSCEFLGFLPLDQALAHTRSAHMLVFTSLRDTSGNVMLEALGSGVPVICFDHQGARDIVTNTSGIKILPTTPAQAVDAIAEAIQLVEGDRHLLRRLSAGAVERAHAFTWQKNGDAMADAYTEALQQTAQQLVLARSRFEGSHYDVCH